MSDPVRRAEDGAREEGWSVRGIPMTPPDPPEPGNKMTEAVMPEQSEWKVYCLNVYEWWVARSLDEAKVNAAKLWFNQTVAEAEADEAFDDPYELDAERMERLRFTDDDGTVRSFRDQLAKRIAEGLTEPGSFATTEF